MRSWTPLIALFGVLGTIVFLGVFERLTSTPAALLATAAELPALAQLAASFLTALIAMVVAGITYQQWRTAHTKVALDLFASRLAVYEKVMQALRLVIGPGRPVDNEPLKLLHEARSQAQFLFQSEVAAYIQTLIGDVATMGLCHQMMEAAQQGLEAVGDDRNWPELNMQVSLHFFEAEKDLPRLMAPYTLMGNTLPGKTPERLPPKAGSAAD